MSELSKVIVDLNRSGLNDADIARELEQAGTKTTQATINRLKHGRHKNTNFTLGSALVALHRRRLGVSVPG